MSSALWGFATLILGITGLAHSQCPNIDGFFSYDPTSPCGPQRWRERFPLCAGRRQSPIDIVTDTTMRETSTVSDRIFYRPSTAVMGTFVNTGHGPGFIANRNSAQNILRMAGHGRSRPRYVFRELRFRIGANQSAFGSEHTVDGIGHTGEIQLLNNRIDSRRRGTVIAVGIFFNVVQQCGSYVDQLISNYIVNIRNYLNETDGMVTPSLLLPSDGKYYTYIGSETSPDCSPGYRWIVFKTPTSICQTNFNILRGLGTWDPVNPVLGIAGNNRPVQRVGAPDLKPNYRKTCKTNVRTKTVNHLLKKTTYYRVCPSEITMGNVITLKRRN